MSRRNIPLREVIGVALSVLFFAAIAAACLFVADCTGNIYHDAQRYVSPGGEYVITVRSGNQLYLTDLRNIKVSAEDTGLLFGTNRISRVYKSVG